MRNRRRNMRRRQSAIPRRIQKESDNVALRSANILLFGFLCNDFFALVVTAFGAHYVAFDKFVALGALNKSGCRKLPVCKTGIGLGFGDFIFR